MKRTKNIRRERFRKVHRFGSLSMALVGVRMLISILLWVVIVFFGFIFIGMLFNFSVTGTSGAIMGVSLIIIFACVQGLNRNEVSQVCEAINNLGGQAAFTAGNCLIKNDGGFPINKESDRYIYFTQQ